MLNYGDFDSVPQIVGRGREFQYDQCINKDVSVCRLHSYVGINPGHPSRGRTQLTSAHLINVHIDGSHGL
jgi:hypothetical protein